VQVCFDIVGDDGNAAADGGDSDHDGNGDDDDYFKSQ
jgi:hypothetical protein